MEQWAAQLKAALDRQGYGGAVDSLMAEYGYSLDVAVQGVIMVLPPAVAEWITAGGVEP